jgi:hypothetical protein
VVLSISSLTSTILPGAAPGRPTGRKHVTELWNAVLGLSLAVSFEGVRKASPAPCAISAHRGNLGDSALQTPRGKTSRRGKIKHGLRPSGIGAGSTARPGFSRKNELDREDPDGDRALGVAAKACLPVRCHSLGESYPRGLPSVRDQNQKLTRPRQGGHRSLGSRESPKRGGAHPSSHRSRERHQGCCGA